MKHDRWGLGKHKYYPTMRPIESDIGLPEPTQMIERIGQQHLLVQTVTTCAMEMMKTDGSDRRLGVVLELEGRFNRTEISGHQQAVLDLDAAVILYKCLQQSLATILVPEEGEL